MTLALCLTSIALLFPPQSERPPLTASDFITIERLDYDSVIHRFGGLHVVSNSDKAVLAFGVTLTFVATDGALTVRHMTHDLTPTLPLAGAWVFGLPGIHHGELHKGERDVFRSILPDPPATDYVNAGISFVVFSDNTAVGGPEEEIARMFEHRRQLRDEYRAWLSKLRAIDASCDIEARLNALLVEAKRAKQAMTTDLPEGTGLIEMEIVNCLRSIKEAVNLPQDCLATAIKSVDSYYCAYAAHSERKSDSTRTDGTTQVIEVPR